MYNFLNISCISPYVPTLFVLNNRLASPFLNLEIAL